MTLFWRGELPDSATMEIVEALRRTKELARHEDLKPAAAYLLDFLDARRADYAVLQHMVRQRLDPNDPDNLHDVLELAWAAYGESAATADIPPDESMTPSDDFTYALANDAEARSRRVDYDQFVFGEPERPAGRQTLGRNTSHGLVARTHGSSAENAETGLPGDAIHVPPDVASPRGGSEPTLLGASGGGLPATPVEHSPTAAEVPLQCDAPPPASVDLPLEESPEVNGEDERSTQPEADSADDDTHTLSQDDLDDDVAQWLGLFDESELIELAEAGEEEQEALADAIEVADLPLPVGEEPDEEEDPDEDADSDDRDALSDYYGSGWQSGASDFDVTWEELSLDEEDVEDDSTRVEFSEEVDTDARITRAQRALQVAIEVGNGFDLETKEIFQLAEIFAASGWSATKTSVIAALSSDVTFEELWMAWQIKNIWLEHPEFSMSVETLLKYPYLADGRTSGKYHVLSWPGAIRLLRAFPGLHDVEEVEVFLNDCFDHWYRRPKLWRSCRSFISYVDCRTGRPRGSLDIWPGHLFDDYHDDIQWGWVSGGTGVTTPAYKFLESKNLLPDAKHHPVPRGGHNADDGDSSPSAYEP